MPLTPPPLAVPKTAPAALAAAGFDRGANPCLLLPVPRDMSGALPLDPRLLLRCPKPPHAALAAAGFDRGANPCSLLPAPRALAGVAFCKRRAKTLHISSSGTTFVCALSPGTTVPGLFVSGNRQGPPATSRLLQYGTVSVYNIRVLTDGMIYGR